jgi:ATP-dependent RNA helicase DeaD
MGAFRHPYKNSVSNAPKWLAFYPSSLDTITENIYIFLIDFVFVSSEISLTTAVKMERPQRFLDITLEPSLQEAIARAGYTRPTPIQAYFIPRALLGRDVIGQAQTGTGKTAAFLIPFLNSWKPSREAGPHAIILVPTRELVTQVAEEAVKLAPDPRCKTVAIYGGQRIRGQIEAMRGGFSIAVGTPGRILDHLSRGTLNLGHVRYLVLDEADRMLDIGFRPDIERILRRCPSERQTHLLSATLPAPVLRLATRYMINPVHINLAPKKITVEKIRQTYITVDKHRKFDLLNLILEREHVKQCIVFCERKRWAQQLFDELKNTQHNAAVMHGDLDQPQRERIMKRFKAGKVDILVATDVVGRGIDVRDISHIINYDLPEDPENYVHRIGRTGRMGKDGIAIAFVTPEQGEQLTRIEAFINKQLDAERIEGFEAFAPKVEQPKEEKKPVVPVFGRRTKKYRRGI